MNELREQMMAAAKKRDEERRENVMRYDAEKKKEEQQMNEHSEDFVRYDLLFLLRYDNFSGSALRPK